MRAVQPPAVRAITIVLVDGGMEYATTFQRAFKAAQPQTGFVWHQTAAAATEYLALCGHRYALPDLVMVNRRLPDGGDGYTVLAAVRALAQLAALPVLLLGSDVVPDTPEMTLATEEAVAAGAAGYLCKPADASGYPTLVRDVLAWWAAREDEKMLRTFCATMTAGSSSAQPARVESSPLMSIPASPAFVGTPENPLAQLARHLGDFVGYLTGGNVPNTSGLLVDRKLMEITIACREVGIDERHARGRSQDPVIVGKRGRVIRRLMAMEWSNTELLERFEVRKRTIVDLRREYREELQRSCAVVARVGR